MRTSICTVEQAQVALHAFVAGPMQDLNRDALAGATDAEHVVAQVRQALRPLIEVPLDDIITLRTHDAATVLDLAGFALLSMERAAQARGAAAGDAMREVEGFPERLLALGHAAGQPPTLTHDGMWLRRRNDDGLSFTGDCQELRFGTAVRSIEMLHGRIAQAVEGIVTGRVAIEDPEVVGRLRECADLGSRVRGCYAALMAKGVDGRLAMTPLFFRTVFRSFLVSVDVDGHLWRGPNAANVPMQAIVDHVLGMTVPVYGEHLVERLRYLQADDRHAVLDAMGAPSVLGRVGAALRVDLADSDPYDIAAALVRRPTIVPVADAWLHAVQELGRASARHWQLIRWYLDKSVPEGEEAATVDAGHGTGGRTHEKTKEVYEMRRFNGGATKLRRAVDALKTTA